MEQLSIYTKYKIFHKKINVTTLIPAATF